MYINKVIILGNLTRDPELKSLPSGIQVTSFSLATNRVWKDKNGAKQESVDYHNVVVFGKQAENSAQYLRKGSSAYVEGRLQTRSWDGPDGKKNYRTEVLADTVQFGSKPTGGNGEAPGYKASNGAPTSARATDEAKPQEMDTISYPEEDINPEDIPF